MPEYFIQPGHLCCVKISEDKWWYRVIIHRVLGKQEVEVFYPDFGNIGTVQKSSLRFLKWVNKFRKDNSSFESLPKLCVVRRPLCFLVPSSILPCLPSLFLLGADLASGHLGSQLDYNLLCLFFTWLWIWLDYEIEFQPLIKKMFVWVMLRVAFI